MFEKASLEKKDCFIPYTEPTLTDEIVYKSDRFLLRKIWEWDIVSACEDEETGLIRCLIKGEVFQNGIATCILPSGKRLSYRNFRWFYDYEDGMLRVSNGDGFGYVDTEFNLVFPLVYEWNEPDNFHDGFSMGIRNGEAFLLDKKGNEISVKAKGEYIKATKIRRYGEFYIATLTNKDGKLKDFIIDTQGNPLTDEYDCVADPREYEGVGDLTFFSQKIDGEWYRGALDKNLNVVIPCKFDVLEPIFDNTTHEVCQNVIRASINGNCCLIDAKGNQLTDAIFGDIGWYYKDCLFTFYNEDSFNGAPMGLYDMNEQKVIFQPMFRDIKILSDNLFAVERKDKKGKRRSIIQIVDRKGSVQYESNYLSYLYETHGFIEFSYKEYDGQKEYTALYDMQLNPIIPESKEIDIGRFYFDMNAFSYKKDGKIGFMSIDQKEIITPKYETLWPLDYRSDNGITLFLAKKNGKYGLIKQNEDVILPFEYRGIHLCKDNQSILCNRETGPAEMFKIENFEGENNEL